jgi:hypothetical protein
MSWKKMYPTAATLAGSLVHRCHPQTASESERPLRWYSEHSPRAGKGDIEALSDHDLGIHGQSEIL